MGAVEPWADPALNPPSGLVAWYDVSRQNAGREAIKASPLRSWNDGIDMLLDGSGHRRDAVQPVLAARPAVVGGSATVLRFDGTNDFLEASLGGLRLKEATVFAVLSVQRVGTFTGPVAAAARGRNDYLSGFNLDFGGKPGAAIERVNAEGAGFQGEASLLGAHSPEVPGRWHRYTLLIGGGERGVRLRMDGSDRGTRARDGSVEMRLDDLVIGARRYSNDADRPHVQGHFAGDVAEVLIFDRVLDPGEVGRIEAYLEGKHRGLLRGLGGVPVREGVVALVPATNPPPVQMHSPGFEVRELPVSLNNINNVRYRPDGRLVAVGYDGRVWLLSDADGDGLEDRVETFWDGRDVRAPIGAALTPPGYAAGDGVFVAAKDRVVLLLDTDRDGRADKDVTVATWKERSEQQGVDALGVAVGPDGSVYFSLGAASYTNPFLIDKATGEARYRTGMDRGTIQRVNPDFSGREAVCTGIRFAVGLAFRGDGELFATDQEGATWRHDGNPFDELLHIERGRHYGFPPRHPRHLPGVIDEPSVFEYGPQHQSTCGLQFNEPVNGGPVFGGDAWRGDALVAGYSRGRLWRTRLFRTEAGYVAANHWLATCQSLVVDMTVSPRGDLVIATHGGQPDWGSGPGGRGHLYRVRRVDPAQPMPVAAWSASPAEWSVAFDRPVDLSAAKDLVSRVTLEAGRHVSPGDRFETIRPGYQVVHDQLAASRLRIEVLGSRLDSERRTLTLLTRPRTAALNHALTLPSLGMGASNDSELALTLDGLHVGWVPAGGGAGWQGWLPHADLAVAEEFTRGSASHAQLFARHLKADGELTLRGQLDLGFLLQPMLQPGTVSDWARPPERVRVRWEAAVPFRVQAGDGGGIDAIRAGGGWRVEKEMDGPGVQWVRFSLSVRTSPQPVSLRMTWTTADDPGRWRPFPLRRFKVPHATRVEADEPSPEPGVLAGTGRVRVIPEIEGGSWIRGRRLFHGDKLGCARCHAVRGEGSQFGPELSNLVHRDYASVRKDIEFPNAALNPDHVTSLLELSDDTTLAGIVLREESGTLHVATAAGVTETVARSRVRQVMPGVRSLMPEGLWGAMSDGECRDLMTFLLTDPLAPQATEPEVQGQKRPVARAAGAILAPGVGARGNPTGKPLRIVLCASPKDAGHGAPGFHDYPLWRDRWAVLLGLAEGVTVEKADRWPSAEQWARADLVAFYHDNPAWVAEKAGDLDVFLGRGGGLVFLHWSMNAYRDMDVLKLRLGRAWGAGARFRYGPETLRLGEHPITAGLPRTLTLVDEAYWDLPGADEGSIVLATSEEEGKATPQVWVRESGRGRVFVCIPGHFTWTFDDPAYRVLLLRGMAWAAGEDPDRFLELSTVGARLGR